MQRFDIGVGLHGDHIGLLPGAGSDINDGALAQEFGVSRTPVREAMKLLCHEGLLTAQPRRGMAVTRLTAAQVAEAHQLCSLLAHHLAQIFLRTLCQLGYPHFRTTESNLLQLSSSA